MALCCPNSVTYLSNTDLAISTMLENSKKSIQVIQKKSHVGGGTTTDQKCKESGSKDSWVKQGKANIYLDWGLGLADSDITSYQ